MTRLRHNASCYSILSLVADRETFEIFEITRGPFIFTNIKRLGKKLPKCSLLLLGNHHNHSTATKAIDHTLKQAILNSTRVLNTDVRLTTEIRGVLFGF